MSISKQIQDEMNREDDREPLYGEDVEGWPSDEEMRADAENE